jgi:hypothetical protein
MQRIPVEYERAATVLADNQPPYGARGREIHGADVKRLPTGSWQAMKWGVDAYAGPLGCVERDIETDRRPIGACVGAIDHRIGGENPQCLGIY